MRRAGEPEASSALRLRLAFGAHLDGASKGTQGDRSPTTWTRRLSLLGECQRANASLQCARSVDMSPTERASRRPCRLGLLFVTAAPQARQDLPIAQR